MESERRMSQNYIMVRKRTLGNMEPLDRRVRALRVRSGLTIKEVATKLGYASGAGYHRYENEAKMAKKKYISTEMAEKLWEIYEGRGDPPITREEVMALAGQPVPSRESLEGLLRELDAEQKDQVFAALKLLLSNLKGGKKLKP
jgi:transcriptional regulator with XRE-family HTH domain